MTEESAALMLLALSGVPIVEQGADLAEIILSALDHEGQRLEDGDIVAVAQKIVSKAEGRVVDLATVKASAKAAEIGLEADKDPRLIELILGESQEVMRIRKGAIIVRHKLGLVLANADGRLRPGMFGEVLLRGEADEEAVVVPRSAVIDSGARQIVLVQLAEGRFAPRVVRLGRRAGERVAVLEGVEAGERVVVAANFLIDAESNLTSALQSMTPEAASSAPPAGNADKDDAGRQEAPAEPPANDEPHAGHAGHGGEH